MFLSFPPATLPCTSLRFYRCLLPLWLPSTPLPLLEGSWLEVYIATCILSLVLSRWYWLWFLLEPTDSSNVLLCHYNCGLFFTGTPIVHLRIITAT